MSVTFYPHNHTYISERGIQYTSVTTLIKKYTPPFDSDYWSSYKALKDVLEKEGVFKKYKDEAGGWENVLDYCRKIKNFPYREGIIQRKKFYLQEWKKKSSDALVKGSDFHAKAEQQVISNGVTMPSGVIIPHAVGDILKAQNFIDSGAYTELLLYNHRFHIAGQADYVLKDKNTIHIKDYKTSKEIAKTAFRDQTMLGPLIHLPDCNYYHYSMQLSIYAWMLEVKGYKIGDLSIEHVIDEDTRVPHTVKYHRKEVIDLLNDFEKNMKKLKKQNAGV